MWHVGLAFRLEMHVVSHWFMVTLQQPELNHFSKLSRQKCMIFSLRSVLLCVIHVPQRQPPDLFHAPEWLHPASPSQGRGGLGKDEKHREMLHMGSTVHSSQPTAGGFHWEWFVWASVLAHSQTQYSFFVVLWFPLSLVHMWHKLFTSTIYSVVTQ